MNKRNDYNNEYKKQTFDRVVICVKPSVYTQMKAVADGHNMPVSRMIIEALEDVYNLDLHTRRG